MRGIVIFVSFLDLKTETNEAMMMLPTGESEIIEIQRNLAQ